ncbi:protein SGM1 isoform X2 [Dendrobium catenatum]|uniref:protein SGM1 isoform X2 n=1 Tax=Dendrobium catenatum TaxID=906689 RepID=UPI0009F4B53E|nr:protein SGM1 isoform X2 [Dendrobium catenatum]
MAVEEEYLNPKPSSHSMEEASSALLSSYLGLSFSVFLALLPRSSLSYVFSLQSRNRILSLKLFHAEEQLRQMRSRRKEDSKANARVAEIFASHRHAWQQEEKRLHHRIEAAAEEIARLHSQIGDMERSQAELRCSVETLQRELAERDEMLDFMSRRAEQEEGREEMGIMKKDAEELLGDDEDNVGGSSDDYSWMGRIRAPEGMDPVSDACFVDRGEDFEKMAMMYFRENGFGPDFLPPSEISKRWMESPKGGWQDVQFDSHESAYPMKHLVARRDYPWKVSSDAAGVSSKLKLLEQDLSNLEKLDKGELSKVPLLLRKQARRYRSLAEKIDDLCRKMQLSESCEPSMSPDFRTQRQTEFLVEAFRLQHRANETRQKLNALHTELIGQTKLAMRRSLDSIRSNFKEIQRNLEIWLARIMGDLEGVLARDGNSRVRDYYISRYPFVR